MKSITTGLRGLPWGYVIAAVLVLSLTVTWLLESWLGFKESKVDEIAALVGVLLLAWPGLSLNAAARRRSLLNDLIAKLSERSTSTLTPEQKDALERDITRMATKSSNERIRSLDWSLGPELFLIAGYVAFLVASFGNLFYG